MCPVHEHEWALSETDAIALQKELADHVIQEDCFSDEIHFVAGVDVAYRKTGNFATAAVAILEVSTLRVIEVVSAVREIDFPYIPGLFSFRELPAIIDAMRKLTTVPDLVVVDGQGIAHPRRFGLASHFGFLYETPSIGCAKSRLAGDPTTPGLKRGDLSHLVDNGKIIGAALRTQNEVRPVYVSVGHRISLNTACAWVLRLSPRYRIPEPIRVADHFGNVWNKKNTGPLNATEETL